MGVKRHDRCDGREAELEARPGKRFRPEDQDDQGSGRHDPKRQRFAPERDPEQDQQGGDQRANGRHLGSGEQSVVGPGERSRAGRDQHEAVTQGQGWAQSEQLERQEHDEPDHCREMKAAHRQQMGKP